MRIAIIDMGTNTFHLLIAEVLGGTHSILLRERRPVKIGEKGINKGMITEEAWQRAINTMADFKKIISDNEVVDIYATATSAIRNAKNGSQLIADIKTKTQIEATIISGIREAELILLGVKNAVALGGEKSLIMDIGGGSIEFIIANQQNTFWLKSFEIGGQRLIEKFHNNDPISSNEIDELIKYFSENLRELKEACKVHCPTVLVGCSGTFDTLSDIHCQQHSKERNNNDTEYPLSLESFNQIYRDLLIKDRNERLQIPGMIEMRVDMIVVASVLIHYVISEMAIQQIRVSGYALKEGNLFNVLDTLSSN